MSDNHGNRSDPYRVLGVSPSASEKQIRKAYLSLAKQYHPDRGGDAARFDEITKAWNALAALESVPKSAPQTAPKAPQPPRTRATSGSRKTRSTSNSVRYIPPLTDGPVRPRKNSRISVDSLLAQQVVHGKIPGGLLGKKHRAMHAQLSETLQTRLQSALPAVRIFHGVKLSWKLTLDTVLLGGTKAAVLAVVYAPPDVYRFSGTELIGRKRIELPDLTEAVTKLQELLPGIQVGGFVVVFSSNPHAPTIQATDSLNTLGLTEIPASIMDAVRDLKFFIGTGDHNVVDRTAMGQLISKL